ncbi:histidinol dehydrogenase [Niameybacter massiliensis]|uniref:Histidinol dehydrogenase n=1 Tax=Holtiella tumoricola TaxID=3018743 RepID=A0AA42DKE7_9FIRM|nr:histidinol dehydrogenase [Holtiella tumoricola]MDA3730589.1 histidinol dehydrogenase [Holtiella tumoricola]
MFFNILEERGNLDTSKFALGVKEIVENVRHTGDAALFNYTHQWDNANVTAENVQISNEEMKKAYEELPDNLKKAMVLSYERIRAFHEKQKQNTWMDVKPNGEILGQRVIPLSSVGVYVPGGKAAYPSSVLMNIVPAKVAGVEKIVMVTPISKAVCKDGKVPQNVLAAAYLAGVDELYTIGGAQAVAALAFGTETIPKVDKIVGPGNIYVALAKREVYGYVSIDSIAGPSEILIIADESANPTYVAADLLSQAEHDELASSVLITPSRALALKVQEEVGRLYNQLPRQEILKKSLKNYSVILIEENLEKACETANDIAPEHLELAVATPFEWLGKIKNAGAVFLGHYTPEPLGDYMAGPNHVLPTSGTARFFSPLGVEDYVKRSSVLSFTPESFYALADQVIDFAESESLYAHALSVKVRKENQ